MTACYERELQARPGLSGVVEVVLSLGPGGEVIGAKIASSTLKDHVVESCLLRLLRSLSFPKPQGGAASLRFKLRLSPG